MVDRVVRSGRIAANREAWEDRLPVYRYGRLLHVNRAHYHVLLFLLFRQTFNLMAGGAASVELSMAFHARHDAL